MYNSEDNEGAVETFSNFGAEEGSLRPVPEQLENIKHENIIPGSFSFVQRTRQRQQGTKNKGLFSDPDPVFVPFFVPDLSKQEQAGDKQLFTPFSFSVHL